MMDDVPTDEAYILAAFVAAHPWVPPAEEWAQRMPSSVVTVSDCLANFEPADQDPLTAPWLVSLDDGRTIAVAIYVVGSAAPIALRDAAIAGATRVAVAGMA